MSDDTENFYEATRLPDGSIRVLARAVDDQTGIVGHIDRVIKPDDPDYDRFSGTVTEKDAD